MPNIPNCTSLQTLNSSTLYESLLESYHKLVKQKALLLIELKNPLIGPHFWLIANQTQVFIDETKNIIDFIKSKDIFIEDFDLMMKIGEVLCELEAMMESVQRVKMCHNNDEHAANCISRINNILQNKSTSTKPQVLECYRDSNVVFSYTLSLPLNNMISKLENTFRYLDETLSPKEIENIPNDSIDSLVDEITTKWCNYSENDKKSLLQRIESTKISGQLHDLLVCLLTQSPEQTLQFCDKIVYSMDSKTSNDLLKLIDFIYKHIKSDSLRSVFGILYYDLKRLSTPSTIEPDLSQITQIENRFKDALKQFSILSTGLSKEEKLDINVTINRIELILDEFTILIPSNETTNEKSTTHSPLDVIDDRYYIDTPNHIYQSIFDQASKNMEITDFCPYCFERENEEVNIVIKLIQFRKNDPLYFFIANYAGEPHYLVNQNNVPLQLQWQKSCDPPNLLESIPLLPRCDFDVPLVCQHLCKKLNIRVTTEGNLAKVFLNEKGIPFENEPFYVSPFPENVDRKLSSDEEFFVVTVKPSDFGTVKISPIPKFRSMGIIVEPNFDFSIIAHQEKNLKPIIAQSPKCPACYLPTFYLSRLYMKSDTIWLTVFDHINNKFNHVVDTKRYPIKVLLSKDAKETFFHSNNHFPLKMNKRHERRCLRLNNQSGGVNDFLPLMEAEIMTFSKEANSCLIKSKYFDFCDLGLMLVECQPGILTLGEVCVEIPIRPSESCDKCDLFFCNYPLLSESGPPLTLCAKQIDRGSYCLEIQLKKTSHKLCDSDHKLLIFEDIYSLLDTDYTDYLYHQYNKPVKIKCGYMASEKGWVYWKSLTYSHLCEHIVKLMNLHIDDNHHLVLNWPLSENSKNIYFYQTRRSRKPHNNRESQLIQNRSKRPLLLTKNSPGPIKLNQFC